MPKSKSPVILVADDLTPEQGKSQRSNAVKTWASHLASRLGSTIDLAYAIDLSLYEWRSIDYKQYVLEFFSERKKALQKNASTFKVPTRPLFIDGDPVQKLTSLASKTGTYELLAIGTHGRKGLGRLFLGSVAEEIIRNAKIPVLTVGPHAQASTPHPSKTHPFKILVPTGLTPNTDRAIQYAANLAKRLNAELILFHSLQESLHPMLQTAFVVPDAAAELQNLLNDLKEDALQQLTTKAAKLQKLGIPVSVALDFKSRSATDAILKEAEKSDVSLLVLGTHGRSLIAGAFFGRTARDVILKATVPVITVRSRSK